MIIQNRILKSPVVMPAVYDDALTYVEQIKILDAKLNEVIELFNQLEYGALEQANKYTDQKIEAVQQEFELAFSSYKKQINDQFAALEAQLQQEIKDATAEMKIQLQTLIEQVTDLTNSLQKDIDRLQISVNTLFDALARTKIEMRHEMEVKFAEIMQYVDQKIVAKLGSGIIVFNPLQKRNTDLNTALHDLYKLTTTVYSLTAAEYKSLGLTVEEYKNLKITVNEYLYHGKLIFFRQLYFPDYDGDFQKVYDYINSAIAGEQKNYYMISPFTGKLDLISNVVDDLADLHKDGITVDQYLQANLTVDDYAAKQIGAHDYAWNGYYLINTDAIPKETLEEQVRELQRIVAEWGASNVTQEEFDSLKQTVSDNGNKLLAAERDITDIQSNVSDLQNDVNDNMADISALQLAVSGVRETLTTIESDMETLETKIEDEINGLNVTLTTVDQSLQKQIDEMKQLAVEAHNDLQSSIDSISSGLNSINIVY